MKAAVMQGPQQFEIKDIPRPVPGPSEVLIKVQACAICGSDLTVYKLGVQGRVLGHEMAGDVVETGCEVADWKPGDRVVVEPSILCEECYWCRHQQPNLCDSLGYTGLATDGGLAELVKVPAYQLHRLPAELSYQEGALIEPLAVALHGVRLSRLQAGESVAVFGCGAVGLFTLLWARERKAGKIIATDVVAARLKAPRGLADVLLNPSETDAVSRILEETSELGPHVIYECSGNNQAQLDAINTVRKGGRIILLGMGYEAASTLFMQLTMKEIELKGSLGYLPSQGGEFAASIEAVCSRRIDLGDIPVSTFTLDAVGQVFELLAHGEISKAVIIA